MKAVPFSILIIGMLIVHQAHSAVLRRNAFLAAAKPHPVNWRPEETISPAEFERKLALISSVVKGGPLHKVPIPRSLATGFFLFDFVEYLIESFMTFVMWGTGQGFLIFVVLVFLIIMAINKNDTKAQPGKNKSRKLSKKISESELNVAKQLRRNLEKQIKQLRQEKEKIQFGGKGKGSKIVRQLKQIQRILQRKEKASSELKIEIEKGELAIAQRPTNGKMTMQEFREKMLSSGDILGTVGKEVMRFSKQLKPEAKDPHNYHSIATCLEVASKYLKKRFDVDQETLDSVAQRSRETIKSLLKRNKRFKQLKIMD